MSFSLVGEGRDKMGNFYLTPSPLHFLSNLMGLKNGGPRKKIDRSHNLFSPKSLKPNTPPTHNISFVFFLPHFPSSLISLHLNVT